MVWIHGGAFRFGSSTSEHYGPERLLEEDIVLVSINYRMGPFGFLTTGDDIAPPDVGILDQRMALRWVQENIAAFAGDPERVTLFGESAGGISVMAHMASPGSRGLFHQAIAMSGVWGEMPFLHKSKNQQNTQRCWPLVWDVTGESHLWTQLSAYNRSTQRIFWRKQANLGQLV
eukprot:TRINITY_DN6315_c0_g1_i1.p1 TRINITY_DN6315_c0_g1~~TRINITY_DN6315_c0_g1_i1.p1  ORF type:complete len:174 (-),score=32.85 TRINITY_DN6315_c0_g1_i1:369-890(-)